MLRPEQRQCYTSRHQGSTAECGEYSGKTPRQGDLQEQASEAESGEQVAMSPVARPRFPGRSVTMPASIAGEELQHVLRAC